VQKDGTLDRARLSALVFADSEAKRALEAITHPRIRALARERFSALEAAAEPLACYVVPLLYERGLDAEYAPVVVVSATENQQLQRATARDRASNEQIAARIRAQLPLGEKVERADFVIDNSGSIASALVRADAVLDSICERFGIDVARYPRVSRGAPPAPAG
jgi:dephospho-CoA kinase